MIYTEQNSLYKRTVSVYLFTPPGRTIFRSLPLKTFHSGTKTLATHTHTQIQKSENEIQGQHCMPTYERVHTLRT